MDLAMRGYGLIEHLCWVGRHGSASAQGSNMLPPSEPPTALQDALFSPETSTTCNFLKKKKVTGLVMLILN